MTNPMPTAKRLLWAEIKKQIASATNPDAFRYYVEKRKSTVDATYQSWFTTFSYAMMNTKFGVGR